MLLSVCAQRLCAAALQFITVIPGIITHRAPDYNINLAKTVIKQTDAAYPNRRKQAYRYARFLLPASAPLLLFSRYHNGAYKNIGRAYLRRQRPYYLRGHRLNIFKQLIEIARYGKIGNRLAFLSAANGIAPCA